MPKVTVTAHEGVRVRAIIHQRTVTPPVKDGDAATVTVEAVEVMTFASEARTFEIGPDQELTVRHDPKQTPQ